jgi:hypothetical protein
MKYFPFFFVIFCILNACQSVSSNRGVDASLPDDFKKFYEKFHTDSSYQMKHIIFPLEGIPSYADSLGLVANNFYWQEKNWDLHKNITDESYRKEYSILPNDIINEKLILKDKPIRLQRRFAKISGEWMLIYYVGLNSIRQ